MMSESKVKDENMSTKVEEEKKKVEKEFETMQKEKADLTAKLNQVNTRLVELQGAYSVLTGLNEKKPEPKIIKR